MSTPAETPAPSQIAPEIAPAAPAAPAVLPETPSLAAVPAPETPAPETPAPAGPTNQEIDTDGNATPRPQDTPLRIELTVGQAARWLGVIMAESDAKGEMANLLDEIEAILHDAITPDEFEAAMNPADGPAPSRT